jgi:uncharacterized protein
MPPGTCYTTGQKGLLLKVKAKPGARADQVLGVRGEELVVEVRARPEKGRANEEIVRVLAAALGVARGDIVLKTGAGAPHKTLVLPASAAAALDRLCARRG